MIGFLKKLYCNSYYYWFMLFCGVFFMGFFTGKMGSYQVMNFELLNFARFVLSSFLVLIGSRGLILLSRNHAKKEQLKA